MNKGVATQTCSWLATDSEWISSFLFRLFGLVCVKSRKNAQCIFLNNMYLPISASVIMPWNSSFSVLLASLYLMDFANAKNPCKTEVSVPGMALRGFVFKKVPVTAPHMCDITCEKDTICQSYHYIIGEKSCELNTRTKEARPENFQSDDLRFYMGRVGGRSTHSVSFILHTNLSPWVLNKNLSLSESKCLIALLLNRATVLKQNSPFILH